MAEFSYDDLEKISNNPNRVVSTVFDLIESSIDSTEVGTLNGTVDPFTFCIDFITGNNHVFTTRLADAISIGYPVHARSIADLANHMSDEDWDGVFAEPSTTSIRFLIPITEIERAAITYEGVDNELLNSYKKLVIPKDTIVKIIDSDFWLEHAVEIRLMEHGGIQVLYDTTQSSPFKTLGTNYPEREFINLSDKRYIAIYLPVRQVSIKEIPNKASNDLVGFSLIQSYTDKLYKIRAFIQAWGSNRRQEMSIIFNRTNYDPNYPTLAIDLLDNNQFRASIPTVYLENGLGIGDVTLLIYTTKGVYERDLRNLTQNYYNPAYYNFETSKGALGTYEIPFKTMDDVLISSTAPITGGRDGKTFEDLKNTIIYGHRRRDIPISTVDLTQTFAEAGYSTIKSIDFPNSRLFKVTKSLPVQDEKKYEGDESVSFNSSLGIFVGSILTSLNELNELGVGKLNGKRFTMFPGAIFDVTKGEVEIWGSVDTKSLLNSSAQTKIDTLTNKTLVSNPYYYVLDTTNDQARLRPYYLDEPSIVEQTFFYENPYLGISLGVSKGGISIEKKEDGSGYYIQIVTSSSDAYKEIDDDKLGIQIAFDVNNSETRKTARGYLIGKNENKERMWGFDLDTDFDIDFNHLIYFKGFNQFGETKDTVSAKLSQYTSFIFTYESETAHEKSTADVKIDQSLFENQVIAVVETEFVIEFGRYLNHLYYSVRPMVGYQQYQRYSQDVPETYPEDIFKYEDGELVIVDGKGVIEHKKGDPMFDADGNIIVKHRKGDPIRDDNNELIPLGERDIKYYWDFIGFDYSYTLSQDDYDKEYYNKIKNYIAVIIMDEIEVISPKRIERTNILFKPRSTVGFTRVVMNEGQEIDIRNDMRFSIIYYLTKEGYANKNLKSSLRTNSHKTTNTVLLKNTISRSDLIKELRPSSENNVVDVNVTISSGERNIDVVSNIDNTNGFAVRKKLTVTGDGFLTIEEDIDVGFREHRVTSENTTVSLEE